jgi:hypothetical protein
MRDQDPASESPPEALQAYLFDDGAQLVARLRSIRGNACCRVWPLAPESYERQGASVDDLLLFAFTESVRVDEDTRLAAVCQRPSVHSVPIEDFPGVGRPLPLQVLPPGRSQLRHGGSTEAREGPSLRPTRRRAHVYLEPTDGPWLLVQDRARPRYSRPARWPTWNFAGGHFSASHRVRQVLDNLRTGGDSLKTYRRRRWR